MDNKKNRRRPTRTVTVGPVLMGSDHPVVCQTMGTTDTRDVEESVAQILRCEAAGAGMVRLTVQGLLEAKRSMQIRAALDAAGSSIPLCADIHFHPKASLLAAEAYDKIRVNPGNFADGQKKFEEFTYETAAEFEAERDFIEETFTPLVLKCKELGRAMRIGTNHGSLSARIMSFYGDSAKGMVESALEFANICRKLDYHNFVFSMKASNPVVMVQAYRLLAAKQYELGWDYPLHLGVTEAGEGEDGRMKSAIGIGALLVDGLGDTIRVSLTEDPEFELEPCETLRDLGEEATSDAARALAAQVIAYDDATTRDITSFSRRETKISPKLADGETLAALSRDGSVISVVSAADLANEQALYASLGLRTAVGMPFRDVATSDSILLKNGLPTKAEELRTLKRIIQAGVGVIVDGDALRAAAAAPPLQDAIALEAAATVLAAGYAPPAGARAVAVKLDGTESDADIDAFAAKTSEDLGFMLLDVDARALSRLHASRRLMHRLTLAKSTVPLIHKLTYDADAARAPKGRPLRKDLFILRMGVEGGAVLVDALGDGILLDSPFDLDFERTASFGLLQGCRMRNVKTEFVSCPSCGRTLFDLQEVTAQITEKTGHLPGVTIAIMGCIVNGPGEMADADFGYVGSKPGMVDLYVGKAMVQANIPNAQATDALVQLIKDNDRWVEPTVDEDKELVDA